MAANATLADIRTLAKHYADMALPGAVVDDTTWLVLINKAATAYYDILVSKYQDDLVKPALLTIALDSDGFYSASLPADFYKVALVQAQIQSGYWTRLRRFSLQEVDVDKSLAGVLVSGVPYMRYQIRGTSKIYFQPGPPPATQARIFYIPALPAFVNDTDTIDGVNGWDEYIAVEAAIRALIKEESDTAPLERERDRLAARIISMAENRDAGEQFRVQDVRGDGGW